MIDKSVLSSIQFSDARDMSIIKDEEAPLTFVSPPYMGHKSNIAKEREREFLGELFAECARITAKDGVVASYNTDFRDRGKFYPRHISVIEAAEENGLELIAQKIRIRNFKQDRYKPYSFILVFCHSGRDDFKKRNKKLPEYEVGAWHFTRHQRLGGFRGSIPPEVPAIIIENFTEPGELVVAPCAGSGTVSITALHLNRRTIGYEINPEMEAIIKEREERFFDFFTDKNIRSWFEPS